MCFHSHCQQELQPETHNWKAILAWSTALDKKKYRGRFRTKKKRHNILFIIGNYRFSIFFNPLVIISPNFLPSFAWKKELWHLLLQNTHYLVEFWNVEHRHSKRHRQAAIELQTSDSQCSVIYLLNFWHLPFKQSVWFEWMLHALILHLNFFLNHFSGHACLNLTEKCRAGSREMSVPK